MRRLQTIAMSSLTGASLGMVAVLVAQPFHAEPAPDRFLFLLFGGIGAVVGATAGAAASAFDFNAEERTENLRALAVVPPLVLGTSAQVWDFNTVSIAAAPPRP